MYLAPTKKERKKEASESHSGHRPSCAFRGNFFQAGFFLAPPFPVRLPSEGSQPKTVTAVSLVPFITVIGLWNTDVLKVFLRNTAACQVLVHDAALRHNSLEGTELKNEDLRAESAGTASRRSDEARWLSFQCRMVLRRLSSSCAKNSMRRKGKCESQLKTLPLLTL